MGEDKSIAKKAYQQALTEFRTKHFKEMETNLDVAISIRDNKKAKDKDRNESIKIISRMLGTLQPDRTTVAQAQAQSVAQQAQKMERPAIKPELQAKLDKLKNKPGRFVDSI